MSQEIRNAQWITALSSPLGRLTLASDGEALTGLWIDGQKYDRAALVLAGERGDLPVFGKAERWLRAYFQGEAPEIDFPLAPQGSEFRRQVWALLQRIPYGSLTTYGAIARELEQTGGHRVSAQAVGGAVAHNPISILIPCHRVVGSHGSLTGYAGGLDKKIFLLQREGIVVNTDHYCVALSMEKHVGCLKIMSGNEAKETR